MLLAQSSALKVTPKKLEFLKTARQQLVITLSYTSIIFCVSKNKKKHEIKKTICCDETNIIL